MNGRTHGWNRSGRLCGIITKALQWPNQVADLERGNVPRDNLGRLYYDMISHRMILRQMAADLVYFMTDHHGKHKFTPFNAKIITTRSPVVASTTAVAPVELRYTITTTGITPIPIR
jgi:hypothetical protein